MPKNEGNAHGRHYDEQDHEADENRNHNEATGRQHFAAEGEEKAGGHSDRFADTYAADGVGEHHEFEDRSTATNVDDNNKPQDEGHLQGGSRNEGGHQGGRRQHNT